MKRLILCAWCCLIGLAPTAVRAEEYDAAPRNPFWPMGYEGTRYPISVEPRFKPEPPEEEEPVAATNDVDSAEQKIEAEKKAAEAKRPDPLKDPIWDSAVKTLKFGSTMGFSANGQTKMSIAINDLNYVVGDLLSVNFEGYRLTWRIEDLSSDGKIKLKRIIYRKIETNP